MKVDFPKTTGYEVIKTYTIMNSKGILSYDVDKGKYREYELIFVFIL